METQTLNIIETLENRISEFQKVIASNEQMNRECRGYIADLKKQVEIEKLKIFCREHEN